MDWFAWLIIGVLIGVALACAVVALANLAPQRRGGTLTFDSNEAREAFKRATAADVERRCAPGVTRTWDPREGWPLPVILDESEAPGTVRLELLDSEGEVVSSRTTRPRLCDPEHGIHYYGTGARCECGANPTVFWTA